MMNIDILRKVDRHIGTKILAVQRIFKKKNHIPKNPKKILVIKLFGFGNFIFLSPTLKNIKKLYPKAKIDVLTFKQNSGVINMYKGYIDEIHTIRFSVLGMAFDIIKFALHNKNKYDMAIDFEQFVRLSTIIGNLVAPKYFIGITTKNSKKSKSFDMNIDYKEQKHIVEEYYGVVQNMAKLSGKQGDIIDKKIELISPITKKSRQANELVEKTGDFLIGVCIGGRDDDVERRYPAQNFRKIIDKLTISNNYSILFFGAKSESQYIDEFISTIKNNKHCINAAGLSLQESAWLISQTKIFLSNDTGPIHLAAALKIFCVGFYGPSKQWIYGPYTDRKLILRDQKHNPIRSNHNEKNVGWDAKWWPTAEFAYTKIIKEIRKLEKR